MVSTASSKTVNKSAKTTKIKPDKLKNAQGVYITVHGHFYQPPRENPDLNTIERQPSAHPYHDWNERIHHECYRPNAFARILNHKQELVGIVNNFEYLSFNIGATLMSWLEKYDTEVYQRILEADHKSCQRLNGHGNAIAQVYNHIILPLANERDKITQIRWGKEDFRSRFGRDPEGMWLAETAVDYPTLEALIAEGIKFIILAPSQAEKCRPITSDESKQVNWQQVGGAQIDPTRPYRCFIKSENKGKQSDRYIDIFFYDGPISRDLGFSDLLESVDSLAGRFGQAVKGDRRTSQLISVATDGETFGHHKNGTEKCIAYALAEQFARYGWTVTNYAHYLSICPPTWEVVLKPVTAWSCAHGVGRWQDDCGCASGGGWHQKWRRPLRDALNWLRDQLVTVYQEVGSRFFNDPWQARDEYIQVLGDRSIANVSNFLQRHQLTELSETERIDALRLLEMQRHALLMYTSCGWFFEELSRPEGVQILRYAARAIELAGEVAGVHLKAEFIKRLALAPSNVNIFGHGKKVYQELVATSQVSLEQVAAHYAISSLFSNYAQQEHLYCYEFEQLDYQKQQMGTLTLSVGQIRLTSEITWESQHFVFAVLHLGGWDFHCCITSFHGRLAYAELKQQLFTDIKQASAAKVILTMNRFMGERSFNLQHLFAEERHRIIRLLTAKTKKHLDQLYTQVYRENYSMLAAFQREGLPFPQELKVAAEVALSCRCLEIVNDWQKAITQPLIMDSYLAELSAIATEANHLQCQLNIAEAKTILEQTIVSLLCQLLYDGNVTDLDADIARIETAIVLGAQLHLNLGLDRAQELYFNCLHQRILPNCLYTQSNLHHGCPWNIIEIKQLLRLGKKLAIDVSCWLD
ncbi:family 57 glycoside hydrolase [Chondrocystis sp. NIES-4102]|nr:family 57 glycoside hydrolase [Chondrocystis sp. NIES-4102]